MIYIYIIKVAVLTFPLLAFLLSIPYMVIQYNRYGSINKLKTFIVGSFIFYLFCSYYMVILPLPDPKTLTHSVQPQLVPFNFIFHFIKDTKLNISDTHTYLLALKQGVVIQPLFNIVLTIPLGIYLASFFKVNLKKVILIGFLCSLFFEITQLTGIFGLYQHSYRLFDVDDLMLNTLGAVIGWFIGHELTFIPSKASLDDQSMINSTKVSYSRRLVAFFIDYVIINILSMLIVIGLDLLFKINLNYIIINIISLVLFITYMILFNYKLHSTIGKKLVHLKLDYHDITSLLIRYLLMLLVIPNFGIMAILLKLAGINFNLIFYLIIIINMLYEFRKNKELYYEKLSDVQNINVFKKVK
ncbi:MAG: VanZ family protein [Bacilli bacterium]|jgi:glycopeptide antibiotics resistance protein|nr:VanZ family protein [Bacilli bacterium]